MEEIGIAIKTMHNSCCPGIDGLPADWYKVFYPKLKGFLHELYLEIVRDEELHLTAKQGVISLLEKIDRDILLLKSWRPLTLLNVDYKILLKVLATWLHTALEAVVDSSQTGFLSGRYMAQNIMKLINLMEHCKKN